MLIFFLKITDLSRRRLSTSSSIIVGNMWRLTCSKIKYIYIYILKKINRNEVSDFVCLVLHDRYLSDVKQKKTKRVGYESRPNICGLQMMYRTTTVQLRTCRIHQCCSKFAKRRLFLLILIRLRHQHPRKPNKN